LQSNSAIQFAVIGVAAWRTGASAIHSAHPQCRRLAAAGILLILPIALLALLVGIGPPGATPPQERLRYLILLIDSIVIGAGWVMLREALLHADESYYSVLGVAAAVIAVPLYILFTSIMLAAYRAQRLADGTLPPWIISLDDLADVFLFFGGVLTYLATAAFAVSLGRSGWLGKTAVRIFAGVSLLAAVCLALRGVTFPDPAIAMKQGYTAIGWVVGIPAIPWLVPCILGVRLLQQAVRQPSQSDALPARSAA
jgi:hypothetical protein